MSNLFCNHHQDFQVQTVFSLVFHALLEGFDTFHKLLSEQHIEIAAFCPFPLQFHQLPFVYSVVLYPVIDLSAVLFKYS
jgi:hypothetical protein